jgi:hypothetical protein
MLPFAETAAMLFWALLASGQINMRKVDGMADAGHEAHRSASLTRYLDVSGDRAKQSNHSRYGIRSCEISTVLKTPVNFKMLSATSSSKMTL